MGDHSPVGVRVWATAVAMALVLAGCADAPDEAWSAESAVAGVGGVVDASATAPSPERTAALTVTYDVGVTDAAALADLIGDVAAAAESADYPAYRLTLHPALEPESSLVVDAGFTGTGPQRAVLDAWLTEIDALIGTVAHVVDGGSEQITVDSAGGIGPDLAAARRSGYGGATTTWVFRTGTGTFTATGRITARDRALMHAVQRDAGREGTVAWADSWRLDRRAGHVRLDLDVTLGTARVPTEQLTTARYGDALAPVAGAVLTTLASTGAPAWLRIRQGEDVFASWTSTQRVAAGRDPLGRGWDAWLARQA